MDTTSCPPSPPEEREPLIDWDLLRRLAGDGRVLTGVSAPGEGTQDLKPLHRTKGQVIRCKACGVKYPGGPVCGYCRGRIAELRAADAVPAGRAGQ